MKVVYYDPFLTPAREAATIARANLWATLASEAYMEACDAGLDALHDPDAVWVDDETGEEWRDEEGRTWPEHVRSLQGFKPELETMIDLDILGPLPSARRWWGKALRTVEALPDPKGSYESNCREWPGHPARCCSLGRCQGWVELGLEHERNWFGART